MENAYAGREQTRAKHQILKNYLKPFAMKIFRFSDSLDFIDGFSGPWENRDLENFSDTSIGISLSTLSDVAEALGHTPAAPKIRCIFNEENKASFAKLQAYLGEARAKYPLVKIEAFSGAFEHNASAIRRAADHDFTLLFVDPTGHTGFPANALGLFAGPKSEIILNFMRSFMTRFVVGNHPDRAQRLEELLGVSRAARVLSMPRTIEVLEAEYLAMLKADLGYRFASFSPIHDANRNEIKFHLAYATRHPKGIEVMRTAERAALNAYDKDRLQRSFNKGQQASLFTDAVIDEMADYGPYLRLCRQHLESAPEIILDILSGSPGVNYQMLCGRVQERLYMIRREVGDVVVDLASKKMIEPTWLLRGGRRPGDDDRMVVTRP